MILPFSTQMNGKPTYFVEKIWEGLLRNNFPTDAEYIDFMNQHQSKFNENWDWLPDEHTRMKSPKIHTIREDEKDRWKSGNKIDFFINCRQKNMFRFAPVLPVLGIQKITMSYLWGKVIIITIGGREMHPSEKEQFAINDGFDNWDSFFEYFYPVIKNTEDNFFKGKIIHWTDLRY